jgi:hypothetical protein
LQREERRHARFLRRRTVGGHRFEAICTGCIDPATHQLALRRQTSAVGGRS